MSDILNHYHCARDAFKELPEESALNEIILDHYDLFRLGSQGPDFFYYDILDKNLEESVKIARLIHTEKVDDFFYHGLKFANEFPKYRNETLAYLAGFISHHALDVLTHPFIYFRTSYLEDTTNKSLDYNHKLYEVLLDTAMTQYEYSKQAVFENPEKVFIVDKKSLTFLEHFYSYILRKLFDIDLPKNLIKKSLNTAARIISLTKDPFKYKTRLVSFLENRLSAKHILTRFFYPMYTNEFLILNIEKVPWLDPVTGEYHEESYPELFHKAKEVTKENIESFYALVDKDDVELKDLNKIFGNRSYLTGQDSTDNQERQYFDRAFNQILVDYF